MGLPLLILSSVAIVFVLIQGKVLSVVAATSDAVWVIILVVVLMVV